MERITIHITSKDRHTELFGLLQSLRTQTYQDFDVYILDDGSGAPILDSYFIQCMINRLKLENHIVKVSRLDISFGVCYARNYLIENDNFHNKYVCRLDDDVLLEPNYLSELMKVIDKGYKLASGLTPTMMTPNVERDIKYVEPVMDKIILDEKGDVVEIQDNCGFTYTEKRILSSQHFRSCCLYDKEFCKDFKYPTNLTKVGFREEGYLSLFILKNNGKIGINTNAIVYHIRTPSGGTKQQDYMDCVNVDEQTFKEELKKNAKIFNRR